MSEKVQVTYRAPEGDNKVCEMGGKTFFDGKATELDSEEDAALIEQVKANKHFEAPGGHPAPDKHKEPHAHKEHPGHPDPKDYPGEKDPDGKHGHNPRPR
jgi:hypothetical protein